MPKNYDGITRVGYGIWWKHDYQKTKNLDSRRTNWKCNQHPTTQMPYLLFLFLGLTQIMGSGESTFLPLNMGGGWASMIAATDHCCELRMGTCGCSATSLKGCDEPPPPMWLLITMIHHHDENENFGGEPSLSQQRRMLGGESLMPYANGWLWAAPSNATTKTNGQMVMHGVVVKH